MGNKSVVTRGQVILDGVRLTPTAILETSASSIRRLVLPSIPLLSRGGGKNIDSSLPNRFLIVNTDAQVSAWWALGKVAGPIIS